jgi:hypothetical protein
MSASSLAKPMSKSNVRRTGLRRVKTASGCTMEPIESRTMLSASVDSLVYPAHAQVRGETLQQWSADWWKSVLATPVYAADGTTIVNPQFDEAPVHALPADGHGVYFLYGSLFDGSHQRTATVPANTPIFLPLINTEWSNNDTPAPPDFTTVPGNYTASQLGAFAKTTMDSVNELHASLDGQNITDLFSHRETSPIFSYNLPKANNIDQVFFGENISGRQYPAAADGYYLMLQPLSPGKHTLNFGGAYPDLSGTPPLLGAFAIDMTYVINVVDPGQAAQANPAPVAAGVPAAKAPASLFADGQRITSLIDGLQSDLPVLG